MEEDRSAILVLMSGTLELMRGALALIDGALALMSAALRSSNTLAFAIPVVARLMCVRTCVLALGADQD